LTKLPRVSGRECIDALTRAESAVRRQQSSHVVLGRVEPFAQLVVPDHRELDRGTLRAILRQAGLSVEQFVEFLR
jgi:predicted RNA binding protein YcfA (HicA-like mRNA interferase family)